MRGEKYRAKIEKRSRQFALRVERASPPQLRLPAFAAHARETARRHRAFSAPHLPCRLVEARFDNREGLGAVRRAVEKSRAGSGVDGHF